MTVASPDRGLSGRRVEALCLWLLALPPPELPPMAEILRAVPELRTGRQVSNAFLSLARGRRVEQLRGALVRGRGHRIVRIIATGAVLRTDGCSLTFDKHPGRGAYPVREETMREVLKIAEDFADRGQRLPSTERLGMLVGRSKTSVLVALGALHDSGRLRWVRRGRRHAVELSDGRRTL